MDETIWMIEKVDEVRRKKSNESIGILVLSNDRVKKLHDFFQAAEIPHSYKLGRDLSYNFSKERITILTYHSAKSLEFDSVFLPFSSKLINEKKVWENAYYTAVTRGINTLYISFSSQADSNSEFRLQWLLDDYPGILEVMEAK